MSQNTSHAVMAQRHEPHDSLDFFPTPPWATRALCEHVVGIRGYVAFDPCCGEGHMARPLSEYAMKVFASDVHDYGRGFKVQDFLFPGGAPPCDWAIFNPPFRLAAQFIERGLEVSERGCAALVRTSFAEGVGRYRKLFSKRPPAVEAQFSERVIMAKGRLLDPSKLYPVIDTKTGEPKRDPKTGEIKMKRPSTATAYTWMVWTREPTAPGETRKVWIPPCRKSLERAGDYA